MTDALIQKRLTVTGPSGATYEFDIPTLYTDIRIGARVKEIRAVTDPSWNGMAVGLDGNTMYALKAAATFDVSLRSSSAQWVYTKDVAGLPVVDSSQFDATQVNEVFAVYDEYLAAVDRFRSTGSADKKPADTKAVAGEPVLQPVSVSG